VAEDGTFEGGVQQGMVHDETLIEEERELRRIMDEDYQPLPHEVPVVDPHAQRAGHDFDIVETFRFTIADNPGLIEHASENVGLGHSFLRSMERSLALAYVVDLSAPEPWEELRVLRAELESYQPGMSHKARMVIANKADLLGGDGSLEEVEEAKRKLKTLEEYVKLEMVQEDGRALDVVPTSGKFSQNLNRVVKLMQTYVQEAREIQSAVAS
jgi:GTP-binding protein